MNRRELLKLGGSVIATSAPVGRMFASTATTTAHTNPVPADYTIHIGTGLIELAPNQVISTTLYNGQFPGPLLRFKEGKRVIVDIHNDTDIPEQLHWHGQFVPGAIDGAAEEGTPFLTPHGMRREIFMPQPAGLRFYHSHIRAGNDLSRGLYTGQAGPVYIEPKHDPGRYDREVFLVLKEFEPYLTRVDDDQPFMTPNGVDNALTVLAAKADPEAGSKPPGYELGYRRFSVNGRMLGHGEPVQVKQGERVLFHVLNASATAMRSLALPGHTFKVVSLDGNPVPTQAEVPVLWLGTAERISAIVEMTQPGVWVLGDVDDQARAIGAGIVVEYAGVKSEAIWHKPPSFLWDYRRFADSGRSVVPPSEIIDLVFTKRQSAIHGFNQWAINGVPYDWHSMPVTRRLKHGARYRLRMKNASDDVHPMHLHRHSFELTRIAGQPTSGVMKDVVMVGPFQTTEVDFTADQRGLSLFHCHMQEHMDYGLMALFEIA